MCRVGESGREELREVSVFIFRWLESGGCVDLDFNLELVKRSKGIYF